MTLLLRAIVITCMTAIAAPAFADSIEWEVDKPFRFFKYKSDFEIHRMAYLDVLRDPTNNKPSILQVEHKLQDPKWWDTPLPVSIVGRYGFTADEKPNIIVRKLRTEEFEDPKEPRLKGFPELYDSWYATDSAGYQAEYDFRRLGWASLLFPSHQNDKQYDSGYLTDAANVAVCWNRSTQRHDNCEKIYGTNKYVVPSTHLVRARLLDSSGKPFRDGVCNWKITAGQGAIDGAAEPANVAIDCAKGVAVRVGYPGEVTVSAERAGIMSSQRISVTDMLVVGLGDSFSSGEGNPDVPAKFRRTAFSSREPTTSEALTTRDDAPARGPVEGKGYLPIRKTLNDYSAAQWIDRACHRSAYTFQIRTAIHLALADPHRAVTLLAYGCSGAEINEGLFNPFMGAEHVGKKKAMVPYRRAQLPLLLSEVCTSYSGAKVRREPIDEDDELELINDNAYVFGQNEDDSAAVDSAYKCSGATGTGKGLRRPIDLLLIGVGGNDVGFAKWIMGTITDNRVWGAIGAFLPAFKSDTQFCAKFPKACVLTENRWKILLHRYQLLRSFLSERLDYRAGSQKPILVYSYPLPFGDANGQPCNSRDAGLTVMSHRLREKYKICARQKQDGIDTLTTISNFVDQNLNPRILAFAEDRLSGTQGPDKWSYVHGYAPAFSNRGFCASTNSENEAPSCHSWSEIQSLHLNGRIKRYNGGAALEALEVPRFVNEWKPFDIFSNHYPYGPRQRWLRTMNDVYVLINQESVSTRWQSSQAMTDFLQNAVYGSFHPTAEAHAHVATSFYCEAEKQVRDNNPVRDKANYKAMCGTP